MLMTHNDNDDDCFAVAEMKEEGDGKGHLGDRGRGMSRWEGGWVGGWVGSIGEGGSITEALV